ncbi:HNH endonuclease [Rhodococcus pyridinivorans]
MCNTWFVSHHLDITCSPECYKAHQREQKHASEHRRRARKKAAFVANVYRKKVFEADGYRCHICKKKTDKTKQAPHPKAPTIDHLTPLSLGGTHEPANCRTACFMCNAMKSDRLAGDQLMLLAV